MAWVVWMRVLRGASVAATLTAACAAAWQSRAGDAVEPLGDLGARIVIAEGGPSHNPLSSAAGYGQFLTGTWLETFRAAYPQLAQLLTREQILALREIRPLAEDLTNRYAQANAARLQRIGLPASEATLSLAHALGPSGAASILTAGPARPAAELLSPEAIAANPHFREMTAGALRQWAIDRVNPRASLPPRVEAAPESEPALESLTSAEDFRIDDGIKASEALAANHNETATLQSLVEAAAKAGGGKAARLGGAAADWLISNGIDPDRLLRGDPVAMRAFNRNASRVVLEAARDLAQRPGYGEFKPMEARGSGQGELPPTVMRALAITLIDKMRHETGTIGIILRHRHHQATEQPRLGRAAAPPLRDAANAHGSATADPPL